MLDIGIINNANIKSKEGDYYRYRQILHHIYDRDVWYGDLVGSVLAVRDNNKCVETVSVDISNYNIYVIFKEDTGTTDQIKIINSVVMAIKDFIITSSTQVDVADKNIIDSFINTEWPVCDYYIIGNEEVAFKL